MPCCLTRVSSRVPKPLVSSAIASICSTNYHYNNMSSATVSAAIRDDAATEKDVPPDRQLKDAAQGRRRRNVGNGASQFTVVGRDALQANSTYSQTIRMKMVRRRYREKLQGSSRVEKISRLAAIPDQFKLGLNEVLVGSNHGHRIIQAHADDLANMLKHRRFPAEPKKVQEVRRRIRAELQAERAAELDTNEISADDEVVDLCSSEQQLLRDPKIAQAEEYALRSKVAKRLKRESFVWKPLWINSREKAAAYTLARFAPNFAATHRALQELPLDFTPSSVLDFGSGSGSTLWACETLWGQGKIGEYTLIDPSGDMNAVCMDLIRGDRADGRPLHEKNVNFRRSLPLVNDGKFDLVVAAHASIELDSYRSRMEILSHLWQLTDKYLVLIEPGTSDGFEAVMRARDFVLISGYQVDVDLAGKQLIQASLMTDALRELLLDEKIQSEFDRYLRLRQLLPDSFVLPTVLPTGRVVAPCPHDFACPLTQWVNKLRRLCLAQARFPVLRADGKKRSADGTALEDFCYVILAKGGREDYKLDIGSDGNLEAGSSLLEEGQQHQHPQPQQQHHQQQQQQQLSGLSGDYEFSRVIDHPMKRQRHVHCVLCTKGCGVKRFTLTKQADGELYSRIASARIGDRVPVIASAIESAHQRKAVVDNKMNDTG